MRIYLTSVLALLFVAFGAAGGWAQGNSCEENIDPGNGGCGINPVAVTHGAGIGGVQMGGTEYDNTCSTGTGGCTINQPMMRFWVQDNFDLMNSGQHGQANTGVEWMVNPVNDFGFGTDPGLWIFYQANWANTGVQGCPSTERVVAEVSFCDMNGAPAYYVVGSLAGPGPYDFDNIDNGSGGAVMPLTRVPTPVAEPVGAEDEPSAGFCTVTFNLDQALHWYTENGANDPNNQLVAGYEVVYQSGSTAPPESCQTGLGAWMPVLNPLDAGSNLGVIAPGTNVDAAVVLPAINEFVYLSARVVYVDGAAGCTPGNCPDPQAQGAPSSCFAGVSGAIRCGIVPVSWAGFKAVRHGGGVLVSWKTFEEYDTFGFKVMRALADSNDYQQVGPVIQARGPGYLYSYTDTTAQRSVAYDYKILEVAFAGNPSETPAMRIDAVSDGSRRLRRYKTD